MENISCLDNVVEYILRTESFSQDDIEDALLFGNYTGQTIESKKFTNSDTPKNELNNMTKAGVLYSADIISVPSFSSNYKKMYQEQQINQEPFDPTNYFKFSDEEFRQMVNLRDCFNFLEEVVIQECPDQEIINKSLKMNNSTAIDTILETEVERMSSTVDVDIPIPEGKEASSSVNPCDLSKFNQKSHVISHMLTNHTEHPLCCVLCNVHYHHKSDLTKHIKIHKGLNNVSDSSQFTVPINSGSVTQSKNSKNKGDVYQESKGNSRKKGRKKKKIDPSMALKLYSKPHTCNLCGLSFTYTNVLLKHARIKHKHESVNIISTQKSNSDSFELTILANPKFNKVSSYSCDSCGAVYDRFDSFKRHKRLHINTELGNIEEETNRSLPEFKLHTTPHLIVTSFPKKSKCSVCERKFGDTDDLSHHDMSQLHNDSSTEYVCKLCRNLCKDDKVLQKDLIIHKTSDDNVKKNDEGVTYGILDEEIANKQALINHKASRVNTISVSQNSSTIKLFPCDSCGKVFKNRSSQNIHSRLHIEEQPFNCRCNKYFVDCSTYKKHDWTHTGERPYACPVCTKTFIQRAALCKHIKLLHAGIKIRSDNREVYKCELCGFFCQISKEYYLHLLQHIDENTAKSEVRTCKDQSHLQKNTCCSVRKTMSGQFDTKNEQYIQSIMNEYDVRDNSMSVASPSESQAKRIKIINGRLQKNEQKSYRSKYAVLKSELIPKKQSFVLKDGECTRTCSTVLNYYSRSYSNIMHSSLAGEKNDSLIEPEDQKTVE